LSQNTEALSHCIQPHEALPDDLDFRAGPIVNKNIATIEELEGKLPMRHHCRTARGT
jgi:hypothetical protein